jgi:Ca-activated chloride channel family protein
MLAGLSVSAWTPGCGVDRKAASEAPTPAASARDVDARGEEGRMATATAAPQTAAAEKPGAGFFRGGAKGKNADSARAAAPPPAAGPQGVLDFSGGRERKAEAEVASPYAVPAPPIVDEPAPEIAIDPNGRFATTYRPGGGHLAAFESAVARGLVPQAEREIVGDLGARYAPTLAKPTDKALALATDLERGKIAPSGGPVHVRIALASTEAHAVERPHLSVVVVLDVSGSMRGELIQSARTAASALVDKLAPTDDFSLVTFSTEAEVRVKLGQVGTRRDAIKRSIAEIVEGGGTNIGEGLRLGYEQAKDKSIPEDAERVVMLLSDGRANDGITSQSQLSGLALGAFQDGIQTSSFGLGTDYDGALMSSIANDGAGGYYYLRDPQQISAALSTELDKRLDPVATAVEVRVRLKPGVELLDAYGSRRLNESESARVRAIEVASDQQSEKRDHIKANRQSDVDGGMRFFIPAYARDETHAILLKLRLPEGVGQKDIALCEVKYKDRVTKKNVAEEIPVRAVYADSDAESAKTIDASVARSVQGFAAGETLMKAADAITRGDRQRAIALLAEREGVLRTAAGVLNEPLFLEDATRLERLREHAGETQGPMSDPLVLAMAMETVGNVHMR